MIEHCLRESPCALYAPDWCDRTVAEGVVLADGADYRGSCDREVWRAIQAN